MTDETSDRADTTERPSGAPSTAGEDYAQRLSTLGTRGLKRFVDVQRPYRWNLRRLELGRVLDVGCGTGRNLSHLPEGSVGVDHNPHSVAVARSQGLTAHTIESFEEAGFEPASFDSMLVAHVLEHVEEDSARSMLTQYLPYVRGDGRVVIICPQERGYRSDATHVRWLDFDVIEKLAADVGLRVERQWSFPFPRAVGRVFAYNEFVVVLRRSPAG